MLFLFASIAKTSLSDSSAISWHLQASLHLLSSSSRILSCSESPSIFVSML